jgi:NAD(P)-dependent dehydrogenase (short-subunit alcohol dehydrogenase family)
VPKRVSRETPEPIADQLALAASPWIAGARPIDERRWHVQIDQKHFVGRYQRMKDLAGRIAVVTGGGTGMGRELVRQLVAEGCNVAMCDVSTPSMAETRRLCEAEGLPQGLRISTHIADVSDEVQVQRFRDEVAERQETDKIHLLFNNAGIGGGGSMFAHGRDEWEKTFNVCWGGVYYNTRAFLPMLRNADQGHIVNTSSVNGFWASVGPRVPHTAYAAAKFAVKGFTEALITDLRINAPHIKCSVVMPGHIGTSIVANSRKIQSGNQSEEISAVEVAQARARMASTGTDPSALSDDDIRGMMTERARRFLEEAPMTAAAAATVILDGVKADQWRILVGEDAHKLDERVRQSPERAYDVDFFEGLAAEIGWRLGT